MLTGSTDERSEVVDCTVIVVTYNSADYIIPLLESLSAAAGDLTIRAIIVDNGSQDGTLALVHEYPWVELIESGANLGYAGGINLGRKHAGACRSLLILNPDLHLEPDGIVHLYAALDQPGVGAAAARIEEMDRQLLMSQRRFPTIPRAIGDAVFGDAFRRRPSALAETVHDPTAYEATTVVEWAAGAAVLVSASCDAAVGEWDEDFFMYSEEVDFAIRARRAGFTMMYVHDAVTVHEGGGSGRSSDLAALLALNRVRLYGKYHGRVATAAYRLVIALHELSRISRERRKAARLVLGLSPPPSFPGAPDIPPVAW